MSRQEVESPPANGRNAASRVGFSRGEAVLWKQCCIQELMGDRGSFSKKGAGEHRIQGLVVELRVFLTGRSSAVPGRPT